MTNNMKITIPEPCHENWQAMTPVEKGRFCALCKKNVIDFTFSTDREIIKAYNSDTKLCGRFTTSQLNRDLVEPKDKSSIWLATTSAIISFLGFGTHEALSQENVKVEQTEKKEVDLSKSSLAENVIVSGVVVDEENCPLSNISIKVSGTQKEMTNEKGEFCFVSPNCKNVRIYDINDEFEDTFYKVDGEAKNIKIVCEKNNWQIRKSSSIVGAIAVIEGKTFTSKKRTFFGRVFHSIGNWFR
jgi:hypothetical protein